MEDEFHKEGERFCLEPRQCDWTLAGGTAKVMEMHDWVVRGE